MSEQKPSSRPGDLLLDRYFRGAGEETRERAREAFAEFARILEEIGEEVLERQGAESSIPVGPRGDRETLQLPL